MISSRAKSLAVVWLVSAVVVALGCQESGTSGTQLRFKGRAVDAKGRSVNAFSLAVGRSPSTASAKPVNVTTKNGAYETRVSIDGPAVAGSKVLGSRNEAVVIQVSANGYKTKTFRVTADQVLVTEPNTLNVTLDPAQ